MCLVCLSNLDGMKNVVIFGAPGSGKGTISKALMNQDENIIHVSTGNIFREMAKKDQQLAEVLSSGKLVSDEIVEQVVRGYLVEHRDDPQQIRIIDGYPRTVPQVSTLENLLAEIGENVDTVVYLDVSDEIVKQRIAKRAMEEGRPEDADPVALQKRLDIYKKETQPIYDEYSHMLNHINGEGDADEVTEQVKAIIR